MRGLLNGPAGRAITVGFLLAAAGISSWVIYSYARQDPTVAEAENPVFVDVDSGKSFHQRLTLDLHVPCKSPFTGKATGYPAELCYWTKDGKQKADPTAVVLNEVLGKDGPTFCPDCGRLVVHHNPGPGPDAKAPPTQAEYEHRQSDQ